MVASEGQTFMILYSALLLFKLLKALPASTNSTASDSSSSKVESGLAYNPSQNFSHTNRPDTWTFVRSY